MGLESRFASHLSSSLLLVALATASLTPPSSGQSVAQTGSRPLPEDLAQLSRSRRITVGDVLDPILSPDGRWTIYLADQEQDGRIELYSVPSDGSAAPTKLNAPRPEGAAVSRQKITPGSDRVVFLDGRALHSVPIAGGPSVQLSGEARVEVAAPPVEPFHISPDGTRVVFVSNGKLHSVAVSGGVPVELSPILVTPSYASFRKFFLSADSSRVVFSGTENGSSFFLYSCPLEGGTPVRISTSGATDWVSHPDGKRVVFSSPLTPGGPNGVLIAPIDGSRKAMRVSPGHLGAGIGALEVDPSGERVVYTAAGGLFSARVPPSHLRADPAREIRFTTRVPFSLEEPYRFSSDGARLVYLSDEATPNKVELFSSPLDAFAPVRLNVALSDTGDVEHYRLSPDGATVFYTADSGADDEYQLFRVPIEGGVSVQLNPVLAPGGSVVSFELHPNGRVVYLADQELDGMVEIFSVPATGGPATRLNPPLYPGLAVQSFLLDPDERVAYVADQDENEAHELYSAPVAGGAVLRLNGPLAAEESDDVARYLVDSAGENVYYLADEDADEWYEVFRTRLDGSARPTRLGLAPHFLGATRTFDLMPGGTHLLALSATSEIASYFTLPLDGSAPPLRIASPPSQRTFAGAASAPAGDWIVAFADLGAERDLYSARTDGSLATFRLDEGFEQPSEFRIVAGGTRVVYVTSYPQDRLRSLPIGGGTRTDLATTPAGGSIEGVRFTPDLARIVYRARADRRFELYTVPVDASSPAVKLTPLSPGEDVFTHFELSCDGTRAIYVVNRQLFSRPLDRSTPPALLSGALVLAEFGSLYPYPNFALSATGQAVFARSGGLELYSAPIDGSSPPVLLSPSMAPGGGLYSIGLPFEISPNGIHVAYVALHDTPGRHDLYVVPLDGSMSARKLSPPLLPNHHVRVGLRFTSDSRRVVFTIGGHRSGFPTLDLYDCPLDESQPARLLHPLPVAGGSVRDFEVHGSRVLFRADLEERDVIELFARRLGQ